MKKYGKLLCAFTLAVTVTLTGSFSIAAHATEQKLEDTKGKLRTAGKEETGRPESKRPAKQQRQHGAGIRKSGCRAG